MTAQTATPQGHVSVTLPRDAWTRVLEVVKTGLEHTVHELQASDELLEVLEQVTGASPETLANRERLVTALTTTDSVYIAAMSIREQVTGQSGQFACAAMLEMSRLILDGINRRTLAPPTPDEDYHPAEIAHHLLTKAGIQLSEKFQAMGMDMLGGAFVVTTPWGGFSVAGAAADHENPDTLKKLAACLAKAQSCVQDKLRALSTQSVP